jgi:hypothetical protein
LACLAEGLGIRATARVFEVAPNTMLHWLTQAADQLHAFSAYFLCDLHLEQRQLNDLYAVLCELKMETAVRMRPSRVWNARRIGFGRRWTPRANYG